MARKVKRCWPGRAVRAAGTVTFALLLVRVILRSTPNVSELRTTSQLSCVPATTDEGEHDNDSGRMPVSETTEVFTLPPADACTVADPSLTMSCAVAEN